MSANPSREQLTVSFRITGKPEAIYVEVNRF